MLRLLVIGWLFVGYATARAETVALLPLDGEQRLEIYGQPVAKEIARALTAGGLDVVVVGAKMAVPDRAQLIVDGTIKAGKGGSVTLTIRVRDPHDVTTLEALPAATATLANLDTAASELSARVVPVVKAHLAALAKAKAVEPRPSDVTRPPPPPAVPGLPSVLVAVSMPTDAGAEVQLLRHAFDAELVAWTKQHHRKLELVVPAKLERSSEAPAAVASAATDVALSFHVLGLSITPGKVPLARARVRVRIVGRDRVRFDRVIITDTIVGDREITPEAFAARAAREVLLILHPNLRRTIPAWR